jgi:DNA-binding transcriptional ArsR family regulator
MTTNGKPPLAGCDVLPALELSNNLPKGLPDRGNGKPAKAAERFAALNTFVDATAGGLTRSEILVWLVLYRDCRNGTARTGQADIARRSNLSRRTVGKAIRRLVDRGLVRTVYRGGLGRGTSRYRVFAVCRERDSNGNPASH